MNSLVTFAAQNYGLTVDKYATLAGTDTTYAAYSAIVGEVDANGDGNTYGTYGGNTVVTKFHDFFGNGNHLYFDLANAPAQVGNEAVFSGAQYSNLLENASVPFGTLTLLGTFGGDATTFNLLGTFAKTDVAESAAATTGYLAFGPVSSSAPDETLSFIYKASPISIRFMSTPLTVTRRSLTYVNGAASQAASAMYSNGSLVASTPLGTAGFGGTMRIRLGKREGVAQYGIFKLETMLTFATPLTAARVAENFNTIY